MLILSQIVVGVNASTGCADQAGGHCKSRKQGDGTMPLVLMAKASQCLPTGEAEPSSGTLQCPDSRLLVRH